MIIPVFNGERFLAEALESVLAQSVPAAEVIAVDDGSDDGTATVIARFGSAVRHLSQPHAGIGAARNLGAQAARGDFLAFLDADDRWTGDKLAVQLDAFRARPDLDLVLGHAAPVRDADWLEVVGGRRPPPATIPGYVPGASLVRRASYDRVGPFGVHWRTGEFMDWYLRAVEEGLRTEVLPVLVLWRRLHQANHGLRARHAYEDYLGILRAALGRRRAAGSPGGGPPGP